MMLFKIINITTHDDVVHKSKHQQTLCCSKIETLPNMMMLKSQNITKHNDVVQK